MPATMQRNGVPFTWTPDADFTEYKASKSQPLTESGIRIRVWRAEPRDWRWELIQANGRELPADNQHRGKNAAMRDATRWWNLYGESGIDSVRCMHLGERRAFLRATSDRTA